ncbi:MAG: tetratricopeptide repeat protein [Bacteroidota bacterium]
MLNTRAKKLFASATLFLLSTIFISCGVWRNFTTYFNTYFNAKTLFDSTEEVILKNRKDVFAFKEEKLQSQQVQDLTKVIEKCSKILQFENESAYFDDALYITGKAFFYQEEYSKAQRKFLELASVPESEYALENKLWLAKTNLHLRNFEEGIAQIDEVKTKALAAEDEELYKQACISKIGFYVYREEYVNAINEANTFISSLDDEEVAALVWFQLGKIYVLQKDEEKALEAFSSVLKYSPSFEVEFESRLEYAKLLKDLDRLDESQEALFELRDQGKFNNQMDRILIEVGKLHFAKKEDEEAIRVFREVDSTYKQSETAGIASMMLGEIYETRIRDYDSSFKYYNKTVNSTAPRELKIEAGTRSRNFDKYFQLRKNIAAQNLQLTYITDPDRFLRDSIDFDIAYAQFLEENRRKQEEIQKSQPNLTEQQALQTLQQQQQLKSVQPTNPDEELTLVQLIAQGKVTKPIRPKISEDSVKTQIAQLYYTMGGMFFSEFEVPDSSEYYYWDILDNFPSKKPYYSQTLYALGTLYETKNDTTLADSLFQALYNDFPNDPLSKEAAKKLGLIKDEGTTDVAAAKDPAEKIYIKAEELYYNKDYKGAIDTLKTIYLKYPRSTFSLKSVYFIGTIYEEQMKYDSAAFFYRILSTKENSQTPYGKAIAAKFNEYKIETERIEKEKKDRQAAEEKLLREKLEQARKDSLQAQKDSLQAAELDKRETVAPGKVLTDQNVKTDSAANKEIRRRQTYLERLKAEQSDSTHRKIIEEERPRSIKPDTTKKLIQKTVLPDSVYKPEGKSDSTKKPATQSIQIDTTKKSEVKPDSTNKLFQKPELIDSVQKLEERPDSTNRLIQKSTLPDTTKKPLEKPD